MCTWERILNFGKILLQCEVLEGAATSCVRVNCGCYLALLDQTEFNVHIVVANGGAKLFLALPYNQT